MSDGQRIRGTPGNANDTDNNVNQARVPSVNNTNTNGIVQINLPPQVTDNSAAEDLFNGSKFDNNNSFESLLPVGIK
jgi:hypothetical protein